MSMKTLDMQELRMETDTSFGIKTNKKHTQL